MKLTPDDPRLSAFLLGELSSEEAAQIERAAAADPAIRMSLAELAKTTRFLAGVFPSEVGEKLLPNQREAVLRASRDADSLGKVIELESAKRSWRPWLAGIGAAAAVACAALLMSRVDPDRRDKLVDGLEGVSEEVALLPLPGPAIGGGSTNVGSNGEPSAELAQSLETRPGEYLEKVARHMDRSPLPEPSSLPPTGEIGGFSDSESTRIPILLGTSSYRWVSGWIRERGELPPKHAVRIEELVNVASLPKGEDQNGLEVTVETVACPWNPGGTLIGVQLTATAGKVEELTVDARHFGEHRILGSFSQRSDQALPSTLPENRRTLVLIERRGAPESDPEIRIGREGGTSRSIAVAAGTSRPSPGMDHAATLAGFGMWLRDEGVSAAELRKMLEGASDDPDSVRADRRRLIGEALDLAESER